MKNVFQPVVSWLKTVFEEQKHDSQKNSIAVLDGVRACAIIFVIIFHINRSTGDALWDWHANPLATSVSTAGGTGVTLFFVLSGFLLFMPYAKSLLTAARWPLARTFYLRRALRIVPGYYVSLLILILLTQRDYLLPANWPKLGLFVTFLMDSSALTWRQIDGPYWTLAVEWQFYMILPVLMLGVLLLVRRVALPHRLRAVILCLLGVIVLGLGVRFLGFYFQGHPTATFLVPRRVLNVVLFFVFGISGKYLEDFAVGMLVSLCYISVQNLPTEHRFRHVLQRLSLWLWSAGLLILLFSAMWHFNSYPFRSAPWPFLNPLMPSYAWLSEMLLAWGYGLCILAILFGPGRLQRPFTWMPLRWIGLISYSLYIWHEPLLIFFATRVLTLFPPLVHPTLYSPAYYLSYTFYWLWALLVVVPFCLLCYICVEKPGMKLADRWRRVIETRYRARLAAKESTTLQKEIPVVTQAREEVVQ
jgi:peptidoglycan/LPS O-acetylase OafA/YrhL